MRISAKTDYAIRAVVEMAAESTPDELGRPQLVKAESVADAQNIPLRFLLSILNELRHAGIVESRRGADGGYRLAKPATEIALADVIRAIDGPLANVGGVRPDALQLHGSAAPLREVWVSVRSNLRAVLERVTVADVVAGALPADIVALTEEADAWRPR